MLIPEKSSAAEQLVTLVLFKGEVQLLNKEKKRTRAAVGRQFSALEFPWIENGTSGALYLQSGKKLVEVTEAGVFALEDLFDKKASILDRSISFLQKLAKPGSYVTQARVRGDSETEVIPDQLYFESFWEALVQESEKSKTDHSAADLLAAAAWFQQQGKSARVAYILERLNTQKGDANPFYGQLRIDSLQQVSFADINQEIEQTRNQINAAFNPGKHRALLIGVEKYDHPSWQKLQTPIRDIRELKRLLTRDYLFDEEDVLLLENATFEEIIGAFNMIKELSDDQTNLLIYFAGHGYYPPGEEEGYWIPKNAGDPETQRLFIPTSTVLSKIKSIQSRHTLVIADSCFSGSLVRRTRGTEINSRYFRDLSLKKSRQIITSGGLEPVSDQGWGDNSVFAGKLIDILSQKRQEPLSASELALDLRKEVKNADARQTPEYGRLHISDDESGEFFFVRRDQELGPIVRNSEELNYSNARTQAQQAPLEEEELEIPDKNGYRLNLGSGFHLAVLNYKFSYQDAKGEKKSETDSTSISSTVGHIGVKKTEDRFSYEMVTSFGQIFASSMECDDEDKKTEFCSKYAGSSVSGQYRALGIFASYNLLPPFNFDVDIGGGFLYEMYTFDKLLDERNLDTSFVSACARFEFSYLVNQWFIGERSDLCFRVYQLGGTLSSFENNSLSDLQIPFGFNFSIMAGYRF